MSSVLRLLGSILAISNTARSFASSDVGRFEGLSEPFLAHFLSLSPISCFHRFVVKVAVGTVIVDGVRVTKAESYGEADFEHVCHWVKLSALSGHSFTDLGADPWVLVHNRN